MRTRLYSAVAAALMLSGAALAEDTLPLNAVNKANEVIDQAIEAFTRRGRELGILSA